MIEDNTLTDEQIDDAADSERDQYIAGPERCTHGNLEADCPDFGCPFTHQSRTGENTPNARFVEAVAKNIRIELARNNVTQAQAAQAIGLTQPSFSRRLTGETGWLFSELLGLARFFNVSFSVLAPDDLVER